jgi:flagellar operon protein
MPEVNGVNVPFIPIVTREDFPVKPAAPASTESFQSIFSGELEKIKISSHAAKRLEARNIQLSDTEMTKLKTAVDKAEAKGAKDSLVMMDQTAFIVNIPNRTVITAISMAESKENVFTNIDSVVFTS